MELEKILCEVTRPRKTNVVLFFYLWILAVKSKITKLQSIEPQKLGTVRIGLGGWPQRDLCRKGK